MSDVRYQMSEEQRAILEGDVSLLIGTLDEGRLDVLRKGLELLLASIRGWKRDAEKLARREVVQ